MSLEPVEILAFGAHPDDIEIGLGGTVAKHIAAGHRVGLCDLTRGEMGTNGTPEERLTEAEDARACVGAAWRENLALPDRALGGPDHARLVVDVIRRARPRVIALPYWEDRHPDHTSASRLVSDAAFSAALRRYEPGAGEAWRVDWLCYYFINTTGPASFVVDVSVHYETKRRALACYRSQFAPQDADAVATRLTFPTFMRLIESRDTHFGALAGVSFAEGILVKDLIVRDGLLRR
ncbi:MAG: bacillithiol biosynthesis deacetylase BshB1 [Luteitalea sp.]|nr:bacillithiol biosynthesis deacetylase BshB1 [Luteitalea sp.]